MLVILLAVITVFVALNLIGGAIWAIFDFVSHRRNRVPILKLFEAEEGSTLALSSWIYCGCRICSLNDKIRGGRHRFRNAALISYVRGLMISHADHVKIIRGEASLSVKHLSFFERVKLWRLTRVASREIKRDERKAAEKRTIERRIEVEAGLRNLLGD